MAFSITDLFVVGLGLDAAGAVLLAKGLLIDPKTIGKVAGTYWGVNLGETVDRSQNRVDAKYGVGCLLAGFLLQAIGYMLELGGATSPAGGDHALTAVALGVLAVALAFGVYFAFRRRELKRTLVAIALSKEEKDKDEQDDRLQEVWTVARATRLRDLGGAAGWAFEGEIEDRDSDTAIPQPGIWRGVTALLRATAG